MASRRKTQRIREAFRLFDADGNGTISREELSAVFAELGTFSPEDIERLMREADRNGDGVVDFPEFVGWLAPAKQVMRGAALLAQCEQRVRAYDSVDADLYAAHDRPPELLDGALAWRFGPGFPGPLPLQTSILLGFEFTLAMWVRLGISTSSWVSLVGDEVWGLEMGMSPNGRFGIVDPRSSNQLEASEKCSQLGGPRGPWTLVFICGSSTGASPGPEGSMDFFAASGPQGLQAMGSVDGTASGIVVTHLGCRAAGLLGLASFAAWPRLLEEEEMRDVFLWDAEHFGCVTAEQAAKLRLGRRDAPPRSPEAEAALSRLLERLAGGEIQTGTLDMSDMLIVDADLPRILEAVEDGGVPISCLQLANNYLSEDSVIANLVPFMARRWQPFRVGLAGNLDISAEAEGPLLSAVPLDRGCGVDARGTKLSEHAIAVLMNNTDEAAAAMREAAQEQEKCQQRVLEYDSQQAARIQQWAAEVDPVVARDYRRDEPWPEPVEATADATAPGAGTDTPVMELGEAARRLEAATASLSREDIRPLFLAGQDRKSNRKLPDHLEAIMRMVGLILNNGDRTKHDWVLMHRDKTGFSYFSNIELETIWLEFRVESMPEQRGGPVLSTLQTCRDDVSVYLSNLGRQPKAEFERQFGSIVEWLNCVIEYLVSAMAEGRYQEACAVDTEAEKENPLEESSEEEVLPSGDDEVYPLNKPDSLMLLRRRLQKAAIAMYDRTGGEGFAWASTQRPAHCGTGQLMAHFTYLSWGTTLMMPEEFGFRVREPAESIPDWSGLTLHQAVEQRLVLLAVNGRSYQANALTLKIRSLQKHGPLRLGIPAGTIFQHVAWVHKQNLMTKSWKEVTCMPGEDAVVKLFGFCMNADCSCSSGEDMYLTSLMFEDHQILERGQRAVWDHFQGIIQGFRDRTGLASMKKVKKGGKKGKRK